jgi:hypothetical protein
MPDLDQLYFEDSYFLGLTASGKRLRLRALFALTLDHPKYTEPRAGQQHCYREGEIRIDGLQIVEWQRGVPVLLTDPDGTFDLGSIEFSQQGDLYRLTTEWFDLRFRAEAVSVTLD